MYTHKQRWLDQLAIDNNDFQQRIVPEMMPFQRTPGDVAVITCMDPRINLEAIGIPQFSVTGEGTSSVRIIRTIGGMIEERSLIIGVFLAGIREIAILMHEDCGCSLAHSHIDTIIERMQQRLNQDDFERFQSDIGAPFREKLRSRLKAFEDPYKAVQEEVKTLRSLTFLPQNLIVHGLVYELKTGKITVVINGYE